MKCSDIPDDEIIAACRAYHAGTADTPDVALSGKAWRRQFAIIADAPVFTYFDLDETPAAIVGLDLLRNSSLAIDFHGQRLYLGPTVADGS